MVIKMKQSVFQVSMAALRWGAPGENLVSLGSFPNKCQGAYSYELGRVHDLWWPWGNIFMGSVINFPCLWLGPWVEKRLGFFHTVFHGPSAGPCVAPRSHEALLALDQFRDLALRAGDSSRLVMPNFSYWTSRRLKSCLLSVRALLQASHVWCHRHNKERLHVPVWPRPLPPLSPRHLGRLCSQLTRSLC